MKLYNILSVLFALGIITTANAAIVDHGNYLSDSDTNIDWLNLTATNGLSYDQVEAELQQGGQFSGWAFADRSQIFGLLDNAGGSGEYINYIPYPDGSVRPNNPVSLLPFLNMWGISSDPNIYNMLYYGQRIDATQAQYGVITITGFEGFFSAYPETSNISFSAGVSNPSFWSGEGINSILIRPSLAPIPAPAAIWLFGSGLIGLFSFVRAKNENI